MPAVTPLHPGPARFEGGLTEVGPGVHAWLQPNGLLGESNAALVVGDGGSLLVDTLWDPPLTRRMLAAMRELIAEAPIETVVNSHSDGDHWWGNQEVADAEIVATATAAEVMAKQSPGEMKRFGRLALLPRDLSVLSRQFARTFPVSGRAWRHTRESPMLRHRLIPCVSPATPSHAGS